MVADVVGDRQLCSLRAISALMGFIHIDSVTVAVAKLKLAASATIHGGVDSTKVSDFTATAKLGAMAK